MRNFSSRVFITHLVFICLFIFNTIIASAITYSGGVDKADTIHLFLIGNSFSQDATRYLRTIAKERGFNLVIKMAMIYSSPLKQHWDLVELSEQNPDDPKGKPYKGKSLKMLLSEGKQDVVSIQQYSVHSVDSSTYMPYAGKLYNFIKLLQPDAKVVFHQTWAYSSDSYDFDKRNKRRIADNQKDMWKKSRAAYHKVANELGIDIVPVGDLFWEVNSDRHWAYKKDKRYNFKDPVYPLLPDQTSSLHHGYYWNRDNKFVFDSHHASDAGCYLGSLAWFTFLFGESPETIKFKPQSVSEEFASHLREVVKEEFGFK